MRTIRAGVIGLGVGERHAAAYAATPGVELACVCDLDAAKAERVGHALGAPKRETDWRRVVADPDIDVVSLCTHDDGHANQAVAALRAGKHVMVEKPVALDRKELEAVVRAWTDSGRLLTSNLILRRSPRFRALKRLIGEGALGTIFAIEGDYLHDILTKLTEGWRGRLPFYCAIYGGGIHLIDLIRWLVGREIESVAGMANKMLTEGTAFAFDDTFMTLLSFQGGALGKCLTTLGPRRPKFHALSVFGTRASFVNGGPHGTLYRGDDPALAQTIADPYPGVDKGDHIPDFIAAIRDGREPMVSGRDVVRVMDVCLAAYEATRAGRTLSVTYTI